MGSTLGIHLVWTTYGTWLPGDPSKSGHWSPLFDAYGRLRRAGQQINLPDRATHAHARSLMNEEPKVLTAEECHIVAQVLGSHIAPALAGENARRSLSAKSTHAPKPMGNRTITPAEAGAQCPPGDTVRAYACAIEPTHVHLLIGPVREDIGRFVGRLKGTTSSALLDHPDNWGRRRIWTSGYWKVFLFDIDARFAVERYIQQHNVRAGRPPSPYPWLTPAAM